MTTIRYNADDLRLEAEGHAGGGEKGQDIICAAVSTLEQTLARALYEMQDEGNCQVEYQHGEPGKTSIHAIPRIWRRISVRQMFEFTMTGLRAIAEKYPENVTIEEE